MFCSTTFYTDDVNVRVFGNGYAPNDKGDRFDMNSISSDRISSYELILVASIYIP